MKKRIMTLIVGVCMAALLVGCGSKEISNDKITIKQYKGLEVKKVEAVAVSDADVDASIKSDMQLVYTELPKVERPAEDGDTVMIDYVGKKDGVAFEGGTAEGAPLELGSNTFIDGFEAGIVGHKVGETFDLNLTFPENYGNTDLAGAAVVFTVTLDAILPELTDEIVPIVNKEFKTAAEYRAQVRKDLEASNAETAKQDLEVELWEALVKNCVVKNYPEDKMKEITESVKSQYSYYASMYGVDIDEFLEQSGIDVEEIAKNRICQEYAIELIAEKEKMTITDKDYKAGLADFASQFGYDDTAKFEEAYGETNIKKAILQDRVVELLIENCKQVESLDKEEK